MLLPQTALWLLLPLLLLLVRRSWYTYLLLARMHEVPDLDNKAGNGIRRLDRCGAGGIT
jgi:hypothetical protein